MKRLLKLVAALVGMVVLGLTIFTVWGYTPVAVFEPVDYVPRAPEVWPTEGWRRSTPEAQGMSSDVLIEMMEAYQEAAAGNPEVFLDSMTVVRNGVLVAEFYPNPRFPPDEMHVIHSATKSVVSALVGIAIDQGHIDGVDVRLVDVFADRTLQNLDDRKRAITIRDLLSMQTGLHSRDSYLYAYDGLFAMQDSDDWLQYALDLPMAATPGDRFDYSNTSTFLLSAILMESTGQDPLDYARQHLFAPLGIHDVKWEWNANRRPIAWARMWLKPDDMAKFGLLYLQQGRWDGRQVVPEAWIRDSVTPFAYPKNAVNVLNPDFSKNAEKSNENFIAQRFFRPFADGYGYQWWLDRDGAYTALGVGGQYIMVSPEHDVVFVVTSKSRGLGQFLPAKLFRDYVIEAVESNAPLPENGDAQATLATWARPPPVSVRASAVPVSPPMAAQISGIRYAMAPNPFHTDNLRFVFDPARDDAALSYTARESWALDFRIGLDGVPRATETNDSTVLAVGEWTSATTFSLDVEIVGYSTFDTWAFAFDGDRVHVTESSVAGEFTYEGRARPSPGPPPAAP